MPRSLYKGIAVLLLAGCAFAQNPGHITGSLQTATGGTINNGTLTFTLSQPSVVSGTATLVTQPVACYTSNAGSVVGVPDPIILPILSTNTGSGTLSAGTYFVKIYYTGPSSTVSAVSPEGVVVLSSTGTVIVSPPAFQPASATGYGVAISTTTGTETIQGTVSGFASQFQQSSALVAGSTPAATNNTVCNLYLSDELIPTGTYYSVNLVNKNGSPIAGYPQSWCTYGGSGATINVSQGAPTGNCNVSGVFYPTPIFASPQNSSLQSISGPLTVTGSVTVPSLNNIKFADQFASVQAAINALPASGGKVYLTCGSTYVGPTSIPSGVTLESTCYSTSGAFSPYNTTLTFTAAQTFGAANGIAIKGIILSFTGASSNLIFNGIQNSVFDMAVTCTTGSPCFNPVGVGVDTSFNRFDYLDITTGGAVGMQLSGSGGGFVTDNEFRYLQVNMSRATLGSITEAIGFSQNCDSNHLLTTHLFFTNVNAGNGIVFNDSGTPAVDTDADVEILEHVDITSGISITGTAYQVNKSTGNKWAEGFGTTSFTTSMGSDATTHFTRLQLVGSSLSFGPIGINSPVGVSVNLLSLPALGTTLVSDTATQTLTNKTLTSPVISTGINNNGSGFKTARNGTTCATGAAVGATCTTVITWNTAFADSAYTVACSGQGITSGVPVAGSAAKVAATVTFTTVAATAAAAQFSEIDCIGVHD